MEKLFYLSAILNIFAVFGNLCLANADRNDAYTPKELKAFDQLREAAKDLFYLDYQKENSYLIHWLRDQDWDVQKAKDKMSKSFEWRKDNEIDSILEDKAYIASAKKYPFSAEGSDRTGRPILSYKIRDWDVRKYLLSGKVNVEEMKKFQAYMFEAAAVKIRENSARLGKDVSEFIYLIDMHGFNLRQHGCLACVSVFADLMSVITDHYPNFAYKIIYVNAPRALETVAKVFRPVTPQALLKLTTVYGHDTNEWKPVLLKYMDEDQIPVGFAGTSRIVARG